MAVTSTPLRSPLASLLSSTSPIDRILTTTFLSVPVPSTPSNLPLKFAPLPLKVLCARGSRGRPDTKNIPKSDPVYRNRLVNLFVNRILKNGKKSLAYLIIYQAMRRIQEKTGLNPLVVLRQAVQGATPDVAVKSRRVGGSTQQVPTEGASAQGKALAIRWLLDASRKRSGKSMVLKLSNEIIDAAKGTGDAIRKREETHRMAEANRAFAHFR
ncbi:hypothetical protein K2173_010204 [Erythroxylum novogranatense]|uniref:Ribosomal protein S7 n=1 Tax=Erythroxylum novogranatense TaxID=1862640 RepID=A0AAV8UE18_9ROSI|nr:hypothetical protein K2173_010204 [Erythroxylum novogranatense]